MQGNGRGSQVERFARFGCLCLSSSPPRARAYLAPLPHPACSQCLLNSTVGLNCPLAKRMMTATAGGKVSHYIGILRTLTAGEGGHVASSRPVAVAAPCGTLGALRWSWRSALCLLASCACPTSGLHLTPAHRPRCHNAVPCRPANARRHREERCGALPVELFGVCHRPSAHKHQWQRRGRKRAALPGPECHSVPSGHGVRGLAQPPSVSWTQFKHSQELFEASA